MRSSYNCKVWYLSGKENTCIDLLLQIPNQLVQKSATVEQKVNDRAYQINILNLHKLKDQLKLNEAHTIKDITKLSEKTGWENSRG